MLQVITALPQAGAEGVVLGLARGLPAHGFRVEVATVMGMGPLLPRFMEAGIPVTCWNRPSGGLGIRALGRGAWQIRTGRFSLVHTHLFAGDTWGRGAAFLGGATATVSTAHNDDRDEQGWHHRAATLLLARSTRRIVAVSAAVGRFLEGRGVPSDRIFIIPNGVEPSPYLAVDFIPRRPDEGPRLLTLGRLVPQKGVDLALQAFAHLIRSFPSARLTVAGEGPLLPQLRALASALGVQEAVEFPGRVVDVPSLLARTDLLLHPSRWEGFGLALVEAALAGVPAVAAAVGGIPEVVDAPRTALLVPVEDPLALAQAARSLLSREGARLTMGEAARERALHLHTEAAMVAAYARLYREVLK